MFASAKVKTDHRDIINDLTLDHYGTKMATCSSDKTIRVWQLNEKTGVWSCTASWKAHTGSVLKVTWANPEYGQVISSCSMDRTAVVWEEVELAAVGNRLTNETSYYTSWVKKAALEESRTGVTDVKFSPRHLGLVLATCSVDGLLRIYEAPDALNKTLWYLLHEIPVKLPCSCIAWNDSSPNLYVPMIAVGSNDVTSEAPKVKIYEVGENLRHWNLSVTLQDIVDPVNDLSFAPNVDPSYHLLGVAANDLSLGFVGGTINNPGQRQVTAVKRAQLIDHFSPVWRVKWNITGTTMASSGDDGCVRLWKANHLRNWGCIASLLLGTRGSQYPTIPTSFIDSYSTVGDFQNSEFMRFI